MNLVSDYIPKQTHADKQATLQAATQHLLSKGKPLVELFVPCMLLRRLFGSELLVTAALLLKVAKTLTVKGAPNEAMT